MPRPLRLARPGETVAGGRPSEDLAAGWEAWLWEHAPQLALDVARDFIRRGWPGTWQGRLRFYSHRALDPVLLDRLLGELATQLGLLAPPGHLFGPHPASPELYGYWPEGLWPK